MPVEFTPHYLEEIARMPVSLSKVTVLILDDNPLVLKLGRALLERKAAPC